MRLIAGVDLGFQRYLLNSLPWKERLVGIKGARGVGKTTVLLQYIKKEYGLSEEALYISLDDLYFSDTNLLDFIEEFVSKGGTHLFLDEVHKYPNWSVVLKNSYDSYPQLKMVFTGSSLLEILNSRSDLSRRALVYEMQGMSFREFLNFTHKTSFEAISLEHLLENHMQIGLEISNVIKPLQYFDRYLEVGYFPFFEDDQDVYYKRLQEVLNMIVEVELPLLRKTDVSIVNKIKQLIYVVSQSVPFKPNITKLAEKIQTTRKTLLEYLHYLNDAGIFTSLFRNTHGISLLQKPEKLFLENTNFMYAISDETPNKGSVRETFFLNQLSNNHRLTYPEKGDFLVDAKYLFEVGGKDKTAQQIIGIPDSFIVSDGIEMGFENKIPLWLFGFLY